MISEVKKFLNKPATKAVLLTGLTTMIGILSPAVVSWNKESLYQIIALLLLGILYLFLIGYYATQEVNERKMASIYAEQNKIFEKAMTGLMNVCKMSGDGANEVIRGIVSKKQADLRLWSFDKACINVCQSVYDLLCMVGQGKDFEVVYVRLDESMKPAKNIYVNAYANKEKSRPSIYGERRSIQNHNYHDAELFKLNQTDMEIMVGKEEIDKVFGHQTKNKRVQNKDKYNQYIAIPVFCNDEKMIGLLEIACLLKTSLGENKEEVKENVSKYFVIYKFFLLVLHKLEKALVAKPKEEIDE